VVSVAEREVKSQLLQMLVVFLLVTVAVVVGHLLPGLNANQIDSEIRNALHIIGFAFVAAVIFETLPMRTAKAAIATVLIVVMLGALSEFTQKLGGKEIDLMDLYRDITGAVLYLSARILWRWTNATKRPAFAHYSARLVSTVLVASLFVPFSYWLSVNARIAAQFPIILDFDGRWDSYLYVPLDAQVSLLKSESSVEDYSGTFSEFLLLRRSWSGLRIEPVVSDWSSFEYLTMRAAIVGGYDSKIVVHLSDGAHPGYRIQHLVGGRSVGPESRIIRFPLHGVVDIPGRPDLDPAKITDVYIIGKTKRKGKDKSGETKMYLDDIRLE